MFKIPKFKMLSLWLRNAKMCIMSELAYRTEFVVRCSAIFVGNLIAPLVALLIYQTTAGIPGWSFWEFILFQGIFILTFNGLSNAFLWKIVSKVSKGVQQGTFDNTLIKPFNPLFFVTFTSFDFEHIGDILAGLFLIILALTRLKWEFSLLTFVPALLLILGGILFLYSIHVITAALSFAFVQLRNLINIFLSFIEFGKYPLSIYGMSMRFMLTFVFPAGLAAFCPASVLIGKEAWPLLLKIIPSVAGFFILSLIIWSALLKRYQSAGG